MRAPWLVLSLLLAAGALLGAIALGFQPQPLAWSARAAPTGLGLLLGLALLRSAPRTAWWGLAGPLLAAGAGLGSAVWAGLLEPQLRGLQLGLHLLAGAGLLGAAAVWSGRPRPPPRGPKRLPGVLLLDAQQKGPTKTSAEALVAGQRVELLGRAGEVPVDGLILEGSGPVELGALLEGAGASHKVAGDVLLAGTRTDRAFVLEVHAAPGHTFRDRRLEHERRLGAAAFRPGGAERALSAVVAAVFAAALALSWSLHPELPAIERLWLLGSLALIALGSAPALALQRSRVEALRILSRRGVCLQDLSGLRVLLGGRARLQISPELAAAPGEVEVVSLSEASPAELLQVAAALFAEDDGPVAATLRAAERRQGLSRVRAAALRRTQAVLHGTALGVRWFVGPRLAVEAEEGVSLPGGDSPFYDSLAARFPVVLVLGRSDHGLVGVLGLSLAADPVWAEAGAKLGAALAPGQPDVVREALASASGLEARARPQRGRDVSIIRFFDLPPSDGLALRVAEERDLLTHELGTLSVLAGPSVPALPETLAAARAALSRGRARAGVVVLGVSLGGLVLAALPAVPPLVAAGWAIVLTSVAAGVSSRS